MIRRFMAGFLEIIYPRICIVCKNKLPGRASINDSVCGECWSGIKRNAPPFCHSCGRQLEKKYFVKNLCGLCLKTRPSYDRAFSPCIYTGVIKELVHEFKYKGKDYLALPLSRLMAEYIREYNLPMQYLDYIVPVPLHTTRLREREFNQAQILSRHISREFNKALLEDLLVRIRPTKTQTGLENSERWLNVKKSFSAKNKDSVKGKNLLLVDDVLTTGATCSEAALALKEAGANIVFVLTLAN